MRMRRVILLTSTVQPLVYNNCTGTSDERRDEYLKAIHFYLDNTEYPVIIVDNSNYDFSSVIKDNGRFEALHFWGTSNDCGKGWGECQILRYAFDNSILIAGADQIVKITGRLIINNINSLLRECTDISSVYADADLKLSYPHSYFFCCHPIFFKDELFPRHNLMNDSKKVHFEHVLGISIKSFRTKGVFHEFKQPIHIIGHPGNSNVEYKKPTVIRSCRVLIKYYMNELWNRFKYSR